MPITEQLPVTTHNGNGVTTVFAYDFKLLAASDLEVLVNNVVMTLTTDYSVAGVGDDSGGSVTFVAPPGSGTANVVLRRSMTYERTDYDYQDNGDLPAQTLDNDLDSIVMLIQQLNAELTRSIKLPVGTTTDQNLTDDAATRANKFVGFDSFGNLGVFTVLSAGDITVSAFAETLLDDANAAAARSTLGLGSVATESIVPVAKGGTGQATAGAAVQDLIDAIGTTQGDVLYRNATDWVALAKGTAGQQLRMNSGATAPEWAMPIAETLAASGKVVFPGGLKVIWGEQASVANGGTVTFHEAFGTAIYQVFALTVDTSAQYATVHSRTTTGFNFYHGSGGTKTVSYIAIGR